MRLDKFLCDRNLGTRSQVKAILKKGQISVNGAIVKDGALQIHEYEDNIFYNNTRLQYQKYYYYMLNKPAGVVSATQDKHDKTVMDLLTEEDRHRELFPAGRLDKDTEGFLLLTNDGNLAHRLLSPKYHVEKTYFVRILHPLSDTDIKQLQEGIDIGEEQNTLPAKVEVKTSNEIYLTIHEGKFHQVKRMLQAVNNEVVYLKRMTFGGLTLDSTLSQGQYRPLTENEVRILNEAKDVRKY